MTNQRTREISERIREFRKSKNLSQAEFAEKIHRDKSTIAKIESGELELSPSIRLAICNIFGIRKEWLLTGEGPVYDDRWVLLEQRAKELGDDIYIELAMLKAFKEAHKEIQPGAEDPKLAALKEKLRFVLEKGSIRDKAVVRGLIEEVYDIVQEDLEKAAALEKAKKGA